MFLVARYNKVPVDPKRTSEVAFGKNDKNWTFNEAVEFTRNLKSNDLRANVVLDLKKHELIKCSLDGQVGGTYDDVYNYFYKNYKEYLDQINPPMVSAELPEIIDTVAQTVEHTDNETN